MGEALLLAIRADAVKNCLVGGECKAVVGKKMVFEVADEAAIYAHRFLAFRTFDVKMFGMAVRADPIG